jgi:hypothetical protein
MSRVKWVARHFRPFYLLKKLSAAVTACLASAKIAHGAIDTMTPNRIVDLASIIHDQTRKVDAYFALENLPTPSFDPLRTSLASCSLSFQPSRGPVE